MVWVTHRKTEAFPGRNNPQGTCPCTFSCIPFLFPGCANGAELSLPPLHWQQGPNVRKVVLPRRWSSLCPPGAFTLCPPCFCPFCPKLLPSFLISMGITRCGGCEPVPVPRASKRQVKGFNLYHNLCHIIKCSCSHVCSHLT